MGAGASTDQAGFAERLREAQSSSELTNEELAQTVGVSLRLLQRWRAGAGAPNGQNLLALATALSREPGWFYAPAESGSEAAA